MTGTATRAAPVELLRHLRRARDHIDGHYVTPAGARPAGAGRRCLQVPLRSQLQGDIRRDAHPLSDPPPRRACPGPAARRQSDGHRSLSAVGFASLGSFSARFTQVVGESPSAYRNRWAARGGPHVPGCYLFMRGVLDPSGTTGPLPDRPSEQSERSARGRRGHTVSA